MTASGFLAVSPAVDGSKAPEVAKAIEALEVHDVTYETTSMGTIIEAETADELFAAAAAAHDAVDADRVGTVLKIDDKRTTDERADEKVRAVEAELGREATSQRE